jgi:hypothetical protein
MRSSMPWAGVNAVLFLRQYERGEADYTRKLDAILPDWDAATLVERLRALKSR